MVDRRELAGDLRDCVSPGETIVWRSAAATTKLWQFGVFWFVTGMVAFLGLAIWLRPLGTFDWPFRTLWLIGLGIVLSACVLILLFKSGAAIVLTATDIYYRVSMTGHRIQRHARSDIAEATVFAGDGTILFHRANGDRTRLVVGSQARELVEAMAIPARLWAAHEGPSMGGVVWLILIGATAAILQSLYGYVYDWVTGDDQSGLPYLILILFAVLMVLRMLTHIYSSWRMDPDERRRTACMLLDPRWRGCDPYPSGRIPLWQIPKATFTLWLIRAIYGMPTECATGHEPELIDPYEVAAE